MENYLDLIRDVLSRGVEKPDRTGTGTLSVFAEQLRFDLAAGFPLVTTKKVHIKSVIHELLWFLTGSTNVRYLRDNGVTIWDEWADEYGGVGKIYGYQWRKWGSKVFYPDSEYETIKAHGIDQIHNVIHDIRTNPDSRRLIVSAWNVGDLDDMALPPCHLMFQFYVANGVLSCQMYQRSADLFLGVPFNIASYALLTMMIAQVTELELGELVISFGDVHIYSNHIDQAKEQLTRQPRILPEMRIDRSVTDINEFRFEHFRLENYDAHPSIKAPIAV